mgnify:CR=1 FL=1
MAWVRIHDAALTHPKLTGLVTLTHPFTLWVWGLSYCQTHLTDGLIPRAAVPLACKRAMQQLLDRRLWEHHDLWYKVHDYLDWNDSKDVVITARRMARVRMVLVRDPEMRRALRDRDRDRCRYCGARVNWADRKGRTGATYDHVVPGGGSTLENLVIACRGCNSQKHKQTPEQAGMTMLPEPSGSEYVSRSINTKNTVISSGVGTSSLVFQEGVQGKPMSLDEEIGDRAAIFLERYAELFTLHRHGARTLLRPALDFQRACDLCRTWEDARLEKMAVIFLTTDDEWIANTGRGFGVFVSRSSWCDDRLKAWELANGVAV